MLELVGKKIIKISLDPCDYYLCFETDDKKHFIYEAYGECCSNAYFYQLDGFDNLIGKEIISIDPNDYSDDGNLATAIDYSFITIKTIDGIATIDFRVEHSGYYGGFVKLVPEQIVNEMKLINRMTKILAE